MHYHSSACMHMQLTLFKIQHEARVLQGTLINCVLSLPAIVDSFSLIKIACAATPCSTRHCTDLKRTCENVSHAIMP